MNEDSNWLRNGGLFLEALFVIPAGLVLLALLLILARPLFVLAVLVVVPAIVVYALHPGFRRWMGAKIDDRAPFKGLRLLGGIAMHRNHSWAQIFPRHVYVGADDLIQAILGPVEAVELPPVGTHIKEGDRLFVLRRGDRSVEVRAPVSGTVTARNEKLLRAPGLINEEPFTRGWAVRLKAENCREESRQLLVGTQARVWFAREIDRLVASMHGEEVVETSHADGGSLVDDLYRHLDDDAWARLTESFFVPPA